jgi:hypothetical protein
LVAFDVFDPALRSRGTTPDAARRRAADARFAARATRLFDAGPSGRIELPWLTDLGRRVTDLEVRVDELESKLRRLRRSV